MSWLKSLTHIILKVNKPIQEILYINPTKQLEIIKRYENLNYKLLYIPSKCINNTETNKFIVGLKHITNNKKNIYIETIDIHEIYKGYSIFEYNLIKNNNVIDFNEIDKEILNLIEQYN